MTALPLDYELRIYRLLARLREQGAPMSDTDTRHVVTVKWFGLMPYGVCSCGWEGPTHPKLSDEHKAADDARAHRKAADE